MNRYDRRKRLLSQKRLGCFDVNQYRKERDANARALRKVRVSLRQMKPVSLVGTVWDPRMNVVLDISSALATGSPPVWMHIANCQDVWSWDASNTERWIVARMAEALGLHSVSGNLTGIRGRNLSECLWELMDRIPARGRTALCLHGFHALESSVAEQFTQWAQIYLAQTPYTERVVTFLVTGPTSAVAFGSEQVTLPRWDGIECTDDDGFLGPARLTVAS